MSMPYYEHVFLARQDISAQQADALLEEFSKVIKDNGGKIGKTEYWGLRPLAYKIKKNRKAHFILMNIEAPHDAVAEMERQMRLSSDVLRFLTLRVKDLDDKPSPMMRRSEERKPARRDREGGGKSGGRSGERRSHTASTGAEE